MNEDEYNSEVSTFDASANDGNKYVDVNKIVDISHSLNVANAKTKLKEIWSEPLTLEGIKSIISSKEEDIKSLFNGDIYTNLKTKLAITAS